MVAGRGIVRNYARNNNSPATGEVRKDFFQGNRPCFAGIERGSCAVTSTNCRPFVKAEHYLTGPPQSRFHSAYAYYRHAAKLKMLCLMERSANAALKVP
jgi:hypothetical protein